MLVKVKRSHLVLNARHRVLRPLNAEASINTIAFSNCLQKFGRLAQITVYMSRIDVSDKKLRKPPEMGG